MAEVLGVQLVVAAEEGSVDSVRHLLSRGAAPNHVAEDFTALYFAAQEGHADCARALLVAGANVNFARTRDGSTPLYVAAQSGHAHMLELLLDAGADIAAATTVAGGATALHCAAFFGHQPCVELLLRRGADPFHLSADGCIPLDFATQEGHAHCVKVLRQAMSEAVRTVAAAGAPSPDAAAPAGAPAIAIVAEPAEPAEPAAPVLPMYGPELPPNFVRDSKRPKRVRPPTPAPVPVEQQQQQQPAPTAGKAPVVVVGKTTSTTAGVLAQAQAQLLALATSLVSGSSDSHVRIVSLGDPFDGGAAAKSHNNRDKEPDEILRRMARNIAQTTMPSDPFKRNALHVSAQNDDLPMIKALLETSCDVNGRTTRYQTPLHFAVINGSAEAVDLLVKHGADRTARDVDGLTPEQHLPRSKLTASAATSLKTPVHPIPFSDVCVSQPNTRTTPAPAPSVALLLDLVEQVQRGGIEQVLAIRARLEQALGAVTG